MPALSRSAFSMKGHIMNINTVLLVLMLAIGLGIGAMMQRDAGLVRRTQTVTTERPGLGRK